MKQIGDKYHLTPERVRQIMIYDDIKTKRDYKEKIAIYQEFLETMSESRMFEEIIRLSKHDRKKFTVACRKMLMMHIKEKYSLSYVKLAHLFRRDHTSVMSLIKQQ